jgi:hypothetical protein
MSDAVMSFAPNADILKDAQKAVDAAKSPLPKAPAAPKPPSLTGGVTDQNNPGSLASPDFSEKALQDGADTDAMFADVQKKAADLQAVNAAERTGGALPAAELPTAPDLGAEALKAALGS